MNQSGEAADQTVHMVLEGMEYALKISGTGAKKIAVFLFTVLNNHEKTAGKAKLKQMIKSGKELKVFSLKEEQLKTFAREAKKYGVLYTVVTQKNSKTKDGIIDIIVRGEDASKINRIVERFNLSSYSNATIRNDIEKTKNNLNKQKGKKTKSSNPSMAKAEKSPQLEPRLEKSNYSKEGTNISKESVRNKLNKYREIINNYKKSKNPVKEKSTIKQKEKKVR